jgi:uncharacterized radical SAM superfamily protein
MDNDLLNQCFGKPFHELTPFFEEAYELSRKRFSDTIVFYVPGMIHFDAPFYRATNPHRFPSISVTGTSCELRCEHCKGKLLETMIPATTPEKLYNVCKGIADRGGRGCLISGGSDKHGSVPLLGFIPTIRRVKEELGLDIVVHTGVVQPNLAEALGDADIDAAMMDVIGSNETIRSVYHLNQTVEALDRSLSLLEEHCVPIVPHIGVGLHYGEMKGEEEALKILSEHKSEAVVVVAFMPIDKTPMMNTRPPTPSDIARVVLASRLTLPATPILLGCARPRGEHKSTTDVLAVKAGVNGIAYPSQEGYEYVLERGLKVKFSEECCALLYRDLEGHRGTTS